MAGNTGAKGQKRKGSPMRRLLPDYSRVFGATDGNPYPLGWMNKFRDAWQLLGLQAHDADSAPE